MKSSQLEEGGKSSQIRDFKDKSNRNAVPIIDIIDLMAPGTINYEFVKTGAGLSDEVSQDPDDGKGNLISRTFLKRQIMMLTKMTMTMMTTKSNICRSVSRTPNTR